MAVRSEGAIPAFISALMLPRVAKEGQPGMFLPWVLPAAENLLRDSSAYTLCLHSNITVPSLAAAMDSGRNIAVLSGSPYLSEICMQQTSHYTPCSGVKLFKRPFGPA